MKAAVESMPIVKFSVKPVIVAAVLLFVFFMAVLIVVRQQSIRRGYEISALTISLEEKSLEYERLSQEYSRVFRREELVKKAFEAGFVFPSSGRVFYVQR